MEESWERSQDNSKDSVMGTSSAEQAWRPACTTVSHLSRVPFRPDTDRLFFCRASLSLCIMNLSESFLAQLQEIKILCFKGIVYETNTLECTGETLGCSARF